MEVLLAQNLFHVDGSEYGKGDIDLSKLCVDLTSFSAHKTYGPKGIGALYVSRKPRVRIEAQIHGGGHERGMRSGTLPTHQIVGMGEALGWQKKRFRQIVNMLRQLHQRFLKGVDGIEEIYVNGNLDRKVPNIINIFYLC